VGTSLSGTVFTFQADEHDGQCTMAIRLVLAVLHSRIHVVLLQYAYSTVRVCKYSVYVFVTGVSAEKTLVALQEQDE
jgi:hypothetical protein